MTELILIAGLAGLIWAAAIAVRGSLIAICLATIVVGACFGFEFWHARLGAMPLTLDRFILVFLIVAFAAQTALRRTDPKPVRTTDRWLGLLLVYLAASTFTHDYLIQFPGDVSPVWRLVAAYLIPAVVYWIARQSPLTEGRVALVQNVLVLFGIYLAVTGILEITHQWSLVFPKQIADPTLGIHFGRARGPMLTSVSFGLFLAVCLLAALHLLPRLHRLGQLALLAALPLFFASLYFSYTRSVWIGIALALLITAGLALRGRLRGTVLATMVIGLAVVSIGRGESIVGFKRDQSAAETRDSAEVRTTFAYVSWKMFQQAPLFGVGFGHFPREKLPFLSDRSTNLRLEEIRPLVHHNTFLSLLTETGAIGLGLFLLVLWGWIRDGWALWRSPLAPDWARRHAMLLLGALGVYGSQLLFHELSYSALDNLLIFFLAGVQTGVRPLAASAIAQRWAAAPDRLVGGSIMDVGPASDFSSSLCPS
ncbi:MAG TPA: O-antigen ligase family protein [Pirellulales bacterium]|nr:O-antigen ligase family protein [Pirellulales bacterium]